MITVSPEPLVRLVCALRRRDGKQDPNLQGSCTVDGRRSWVSAWTNIVQRGERRGERYVSLSFRAAEERHERAGRDDDPLPAPSAACSGYEATR